MFNERILEGASITEVRATFNEDSFVIQNMFAAWDAIRDLQNNINKGTFFVSLIKRTENGNVIRNFRELTVADGQDAALINANSTKISEYDIIIPNADFQAGDQFNIGVQVGQIPISQDPPLRFIIQQHTILSDGSVWAITDASKNVDADNNEI